MSTWDFVALEPGGARVLGRARARDELELDRDLEARQLVLLRARPASKRQRERGLRLTREERVRFLTQLGTTLGAGVPLLEGLEGIGGRMQSDAGRRLVADIVACLEVGESLSAAMARHPRAFPSAVVSSVRAGEATGEVPRVLGEVVRHTETAARLRGAAVQAMLYPALLMGAVSGLVVLLLTFLLPRIAALYPVGPSGRVGLPRETQLVLQLSDALIAQGPWLAAALVLGALSLVLGLRQKTTRVRLHRFVLGVPRLGRLAQQIATSRFASTASLLQAAGCDVFSVLKIAGEACGNAAFEDALGRASERVRRGARLSEALDHEPGIDPLLIQMIDVGERSGELGPCLGRVAEHYEAEVPRAVQRFVGVLEPTLLIVSGAVVGFLLLAAMLPLFDLYEVFG